MAFNVCTTFCLCVSNGCKYIVYGKNGVQGDKSSACFWEYTATAACSEGWEADSYDFYQITKVITSTTKTPELDGPYACMYVCMYVCVCVCVCVCV